MKRSNFADNVFSPHEGGGRLLRRTFLSLLGAAAVTGSRMARAQLATNKTIRIIVPFAPSGSSDVLARVLQSPLQKEIGQTIIVENRAGAGTNIGTSEVARAEPDGTTRATTSLKDLMSPLAFTAITFGATGSAAIGAKSLDGS
jgi:tripartite-type tricarboxylate transporter receptor subunit TctC